MAGKLSTHFPIDSRSSISQRALVLHVASTPSCFCFLLLQRYPAFLTSLPCHTQSCSTALLGDNVGQLRVVDVRAPPAGSLGPALDIHAKKINTVHFEPTQEQVGRGGDVAAVTERRWPGILYRGQVHAMACTHACRLFRCF